MKEEYDRKLKKFTDTQKDNILKHTAKMKELFMKELQEALDTIENHK